jgi:hypothetical protein
MSLKNTTIDKIMIKLCIYHIILTNTPIFGLKK